MPDGATARDAKPPRDFVAAGFITLYWGLGLGTFLSLTHTWFEGMKFHVINLSLAAIVIDAVGLLSLLAAWVSPTRSSLLPNPRRQIALAAGLIVWVALGCLYAVTPDFARLSRQHEFATGYRSDASCAEDNLSRVARESPAIAPLAPATSMCRVAWAKVTEKTSYNSCLVLNGSAINGAFCYGGREYPPVIGAM